jgi:hypothetical protein
MNITTSSGYRGSAQMLRNGLSFFWSHPGYIVLALVTFAFITRILRLGEVPAGLHLDEVSAVYKPFLYEKGILLDFTARNVLSHFLAGSFFIYELAGPSSFFVRLPGVVFGTLLVFVVYLLAKEMFSSRVGLLAAVLVSIAPWAIHFSRTLSFSAAYALLFTAAMLFLYKGMNSNEKNKKFIWFCCGSLTLGLAANIFASSFVFVPLFVIGFLLIHFRKKYFNIHQVTLRKIVWPAIYTAIFLMPYSFILADFLIQDEDAERIVSYSTVATSQGIADAIQAIVERSGAHLSPAFLVFTPSPTHDLPFQESISALGLQRYTPTVYGELNYYGILLYPALMLLFYQSLVKKSRTHAVILWWIACYSLVAGIALYDNPNAARNIVGMPGLIVSIGLFIDFLLKLKLPYQIRSWRSRMHPLIAICLVILVAIPTGLFLQQYYTAYATESAEAFDYGYRDAAKFLSTNELWDRQIFINDGYQRNATLAFYSSIQPPLGKITMTSTPNLDFYPIIRTERSISPLQQGAIKYETRINNGFGYAISPSITLVNADGNNSFHLSFYHEDTSYQPSQYLLGEVNNGRLSYQERSLDQPIEYDKWYSLTMAVNPRTISVSLDGEDVTTWQRNYIGTYNSLSLGAESASVSFSNVTVQQNVRTHDLFGSEGDIRSWSTPENGKLDITRGTDIDGIVATLFPTTNEPLLVTHYPEQDSKVLTEIGVTPKPLKQIYYPNGEHALSIFELRPIWRDKDTRFGSDYPEGPFFS